MSLTLQEVEKIAHLARLNLSPEQKAEFQEQLSAILEYAEMLNEADVTEVEGTAHAVSQQNILRDDVIKPSLPLDEVLFNTDDQEADQFRIQAVLDD